MPKLVKKMSHDFTIINNMIFRDYDLGATERGVLCTMLSLADGWNFSIKGLAAILPDGVTKISTALKRNIISFVSVCIRTARSLTGIT